MCRIAKYALLVAFMVSIAGCGDSNREKSGMNNDQEKILQQADGTISLEIEKAACYKSATDPSNNTAEWDFIVEKAGRYNVWLSTATLDTMNLHYSGAVRINLQDDRLEGRPVGDKIVLDANEVKYPYYRADSYMGSFYIQEPGKYSIQVISEKAVPASEQVQQTPSDSPAKLMSVILTPKTR